MGRKAQSLENKNQCFAFHLERESYQLVNAFVLEIAHGYEIHASRNPNATAQTSSWRDYEENLSSTIGWKSKKSLPILS